VAKGQWFVVECAVLEDESSPAWEFLEALRIGMWEPDPDATSLPSDEQIEDRASFFAMAKRLAQGLPTGGSNGNQTNDLDDGIWEFKVGAKRLSWYDTDGVGGYRPKLRIRTRAESEYPEDDDAWWFPQIDEIIRLGYAFPKTDEQAGEFNIEETKRVRTEDLNHDRE